MVWEHSWDYTMDPKRLFNLFNIKYNCQHQSTFTPQFGNQPMSPVYHPTSPTYSPNSPAYRPNSPAYHPNSPAYHPTTPPFGPSTPDYNPNSPQYDPNKKYGETTPPYTNPFEVETPPMTPPMNDLSPEFTTDPVWDNEQPNQDEAIVSATTLPDTEWKVTLQSPCTNNEAGLLPWVVHPTSPKI